MRLICDIHKRRRKFFSNANESIPCEEKTFRWLKAVSEEILDGNQKAINDLDVESVEKMIEMLLDSNNKNFL